MPFKIVRNDITKMRVDAIVNTANPAVAVGRGVDEQIYNAAGWARLFKERVKIGPMRRGSAAITRGFKLPAKYIIHTVGPKWNEADPEPAKKQLRDCYDNSMSIALEKGLKSIAFPLISTGNYSFPKDIGLDIAFTTISKYLYTSDIMVYLVVYDDEAFALSQKLTEDIDEFIDSHYVDEALISGAGFAGGLENYSMPLMEVMPLEKASPRAFRERQTQSFRPLPSSDKVPVPPKKSFVPSAVPGAGSKPSIRKYNSLDELLDNKGETFQERLFRYIDTKGMSDVEVYKGANLSKQTFSKLKQPGHTPKKKTVFALALSMNLSVDETKDLLESAGQAFSPSDKIDLVVQYCMYNGIYSIFEVEHILFEKFGETLVS